MASRTAIALGAVLAVCACAVVGFAVGRSQRTSHVEALQAEAAARSAAYASATLRAEQSTRGSEYALGLAAGRAKGLAAGRRSGKTKGAEARAKWIEATTAANTTTSSTGTSTSAQPVVEHCPNGYVQASASGGCALVTTEGDGQVPGAKEYNPYEHPSENACVKMNDCP